MNMKLIKYCCFGFLISVQAMNAVYAQDTLRTELKQDSLRLTNYPSSSVSIAGKLYGLGKVSIMDHGNIGASAFLMIQGVSSINLNSSPIIYIDGIPMRFSSSYPAFLSNYEHDRLGFLNPNDIASIEVISNGFELPIIGGKGSAGGLNIKTERGEFGGTKVDVQVRGGITPANYSVPRLDAQGMKAYLWSRFEEEGMSADELNNHPIFSDTNPMYNQQTDWLDLIRQQGIYQDYHVKLKGGDGDANYLFTVGYTDKNGTIKNNNFDRVGIRFNLDYTITPKVSIYNNLSYTNTSAKYHEQGFNYDIHPLYIASAKAPFLGTNFFTSSGEVGKSLAAVDTLGFSNPLALVNNLQNKNQFNRIDGVMGLNWAISDTWKLFSDLSVSYFNLSEKQYRPALGIVPDTYMIRQNSKRSSSEFLLNWQAGISKWGELNYDLNYNLQLSTAVETYEERSIFGRKVNAGTDDFETLSQGVVDSASNNKFRSNLMTLVGKADVNWKDWINVIGYLNIQGSSNFSSKSRWQFYPGILTKFHVLGDNNQKQLDLELGYNRTGNHELRGFYHYGQYYPVNYFGYGGTYLGNIANPDLKPELVDNYQVKANLALFENKLRLSAGYYLKRTNGLITQNISNNNEQNRGLLFENAGSLENKGIEIEMNADIIRKDNFKWGLSIAVNTLDNKVLSLPNGSIVQSMGGYSGIAKEGEEIGSFYGYKVLGVFDNATSINLKRSDGTDYKPGDYIMEDINKDGKIINLDKQVIGSPLPKMFGYISTSLQYEEWGLSALFNYSYGSEIYNAFKQQMHAMDTYANQDPAVMNRWLSEEKPGNGLSRAVLNDPSSNSTQSSLWVEDGSFIKLKYITLDYNFKIAESNTYLKGLKLYGTVENLLTITKYSGFDPEINGLNNPMFRQIDFGASPMGKTFLIGLKASF